MLEFDHCIVRPEPLLDLITRHQFTGALQQHRQNFNGLTLHAHLQPVSAQLADTQVKFERVKAFDVGGGTALCQEEAPEWLGQHTITAVNLSQ